MKNYYFLALLVLLPVLGMADWLSFDEGLALAGKKNKLMMVDFYTDWCGWCKRLDKETFQNPEVKAYLDKHFVTVKLNAEDVNQNLHFDNRNFTNRQFTSAMGIRGFPAVAFFDADGKVLTLLPGFAPAADFMLVLKYFHEGHYKKNISFEDYRKKMGKS